MSLMKEINDLKAQIEVHARRAKPGEGFDVRRQRFWDNRRLDLVETLAHLGFHFKRRPCDAASAAG